MCRRLFLFILYENLHISLPLFYFSLVIDNAKPTCLGRLNKDIYSHILSLLILHETFCFMSSIRCIYLLLTEFVWDVRIFLCLIWKTSSMLLFTRDYIAVVMRAYEDVWKFNCKLRNLILFYFHQVWYREKVDK